MHQPTLIVLAYHSINVEGNEYENNDHVALREDIALIQEMGIPIVPLETGIRSIFGGSARPEFSSVQICLTFDDGSWFDYFDLDHPSWGTQSSFYSILSSARRPIHGTSFVIASPEVRATLDRTCLIGKGWWTDCWWESASKSGIIDVQNHSWDHNHPTLDSTILSHKEKGTFHCLETRQEAIAEIVDAKAYIEQITGARSSLFAYPYGHAPAFLVEEFFPKYGESLGLLAAFTTDPEPVTPASDRWRCGRWVCGHHWKSRDQLEEIINSVVRSSQLERA